MQFLFDGNHQDRTAPPTPFKEKKVKSVTEAEASEGRGQEALSRREFPSSLPPQFCSVKDFDFSLKQAEEQGEGFSGFSPARKLPSPMQSPPGI